MAKSVQAKNVNNPGHTEPLNERKYSVIREAILDILPRGDEGMTHAEFTREVEKRVKKQLKGEADELFPKKGSYGWYCKAVQLDLEARKLIKRLPKSRPLQFVRVGK